MQTDEQRNGTISTQPGGEWEDSGPFFSEYGKSWIQRLVFAQVTYIPIIAIFFIGFYSTIGPDMFETVCCGGFMFSFGVIFILVWYFEMKECKTFIHELKERSSIETRMIQSEWCSSFQSHEIRKTVIRELNKEGMNIEVEEEKRLTDLFAPGKDHGKGHLMDIEFPVHRVRIGFYGPTKVRKRDPVRITIGFLTDCQLSDEKRNEMVDKIHTIVMEIPLANPFCVICEGKDRSSCYGEDYPHAGTTRTSANEILAKVDPYPNDETLNTLLERKKELGGRPQKKKKFAGFLENTAKQVLEDYKETIPKEAYSTLASKQGIVEKK